MLNGAVDMEGFTERGLPIEPAPSCRQGLGRVHRGNSLPLRDYAGAPLPRGVSTQSSARPANVDGPTRRAPLTGNQTAP